MLTKDTALQERHKVQTAKEKHNAQIRKWVEDQIAHAVYVEDHDVSPANADRQLGRPMFASELEKRLKKLEPNLHFEVNPFNGSKKALYRLTPSGKTFVCAYENGVMPEHSVMKVKVEEVPDYSQIGTSGRIHMDRKDLPKAEWAGPEKGWVFDSADARPGFRKVKIPWGELRRGWRTVLIKLVLTGILTPAEVERNFGSDERPEWAGHMGKRAHTTPW